MEPGQTAGGRERRPADVKPSAVRAVAPPLSRLPSQTLQPKIHRRIRLSSSGGQSASAHDAVEGLQPAFWQRGRLVCHVGGGMTCGLTCRSMTLKLDVILALMALAPLHPDASAVLKDI